MKNNIKITDKIMNFFKLKVKVEYLNCNGLFKCSYKKPWSNMYINFRNLDVSMVKSSKDIYIININRLYIKICKSMEDGIAFVNQFNSIKEIEDYHTAIFKEYDDAVKKNVTSTNI